HSSTLVACDEKSAKFTPFPSQVAPRGYGRPSLTADIPRMLGAPCYAPSRLAGAEGPVPGAVVAAEGLAALTRERALGVRSAAIRAGGSDGRARGGHRSLDHGLPFHDRALHDRLPVTAGDERQRAEQRYSKSRQPHRNLLIWRW